MGDDGASPRLEALHALLVSAQHLALGLQNDPTLGRVIRALGTLPPEERAILTSMLERETTGWRVNEGFAPLMGVRLRINPKARLFMRVFDADEEPGALAKDPDEILPEVLLLLRRVPLMLTPDAQAVWRPAVERALAMLTASGREACLRFAEAVLSVVAASVAADRTGPS